MIDLHSTMDANAWTSEFMKYFVNPEIEIDFDYMRGWFANSIMCGYDHANWKIEKELTALRAVAAAADAKICGYGTTKELINALKAWGEVKK